LPEGVPIAISGYARAGGTFSGGTYHSAIHIMGRLRQGMKVARERRQREERPADRRVRGVTGRPHHNADAGGWVVPAPTIDPQTVLRSARALERYGPEVSYSHYLVVKRRTALLQLARRWSPDARGPASRFERACRADAAALRTGGAGPRPSVGAPHGPPGARCQRHASQGHARRRFAGPVADSFGPHAGR